MKGKTKHAAPAAIEPPKSQELIAVEAAVANMSKVDAGIAELAQTYTGVIFEVVTTKGMEAAKAARLAIRGPRYEVERIRKEAKAPILALGKQLDATALRITKALFEIEKPIDDQIVGEENRKEVEKQARILAELQRVAAIQQRVADIRGAVQACARVTDPAILEKHIADIEAVAIDGTFQELEQVARDARGSTLYTLREYLQTARERIAADARAKAQADELETLRREKAERDKADAEKRAEDERAETIRRREAESADLAEQQRATNEGHGHVYPRADGARARCGGPMICAACALDAARKASEASAKPANTDTELARFQRQADVTPIVATGSAAAEAPKSASDRPTPIRPTLEEICRLVAFHWEVTEEVALNWLDRAVRGDVTRAA